MDPRLAENSRSVPTVFLIDDDAAVRKALRLILTTAGHDVETYSSAQAFLEAFNVNRPGCLVSDVRMPGTDGMELLRQLVARSVAIPIIMLTAHGDVPMAVDAMKLGAVEFLEKPVEPSILRNVVSSALELDAARRRDQDERDEVNALLDTLTDREREVLDLLVEGKQTRTISTVLGTAHNTVRVHRARLMKKMRADSIADLIRMLNLGK